QQLRLLLAPFVDGRRHAWRSPGGFLFHCLLSISITRVGRLVVSVSSNNCRRIRLGQDQNQLTLMFQEHRSLRGSDESLRCPDAKLSVFAPDLAAGLADCLEDLQYAHKFNSSISSFPSEETGVSEVRGPPPLGAASEEREVSEVTAFRRRLSSDSSV